MDFGCFISSDKAVKNFDFCGIILFQLLVVLCNIKL